MLLFYWIIFDVALHFIGFRLFMTLEALHGRKTIKCFKQINEVGKVVILNSDCHWEFRIQMWFGLPTPTEATSGDLFFFPTCTQESPVKITSLAFSGLQLVSDANSCPGELAYLGVFIADELTQSERCCHGDLVLLGF